MDTVQLVAQGERSHQRWRRTLVKDQPLALGRKAALPVPWDTHISRQHAEVTWNGQSLLVQTQPDVLNPIYFQGVPTERFDVLPGQHFAIGSTTFKLLSDLINISLDAPRPAAAQTFSSDFLRHAAFRSTEPPIDALCRLPDIITGAHTESELCIRLVTMILSAIPNASAAAIVRCDTSKNGMAEEDIQVLHWDRTKQSDQEFQPSARLIREATNAGESIVHVWNARRQSSHKYTYRSDALWAFCTPLQSKACAGWAIYVAGTAANSDSDVSHHFGIVTSPGDLQDEVKFTQVAATTVDNLRQIQSLQRREAVYSAFFSEPVIRTLADTGDVEVLAPKQANLSVMFCDLRGFSRKSEQLSEDLFGLLRRVSESLGIMTHQILETGGVIGDFHGDSAMGFWGWPLDQPDRAERACLAAMAIRDTFAALAQQADAAGSASPFRVAIGIGTGAGVAGRIGTKDQVKVTAFGPVVNIAARLETTTRIFDAEILIDRATQTQLGQEFLGQHRIEFRPLGPIRMYGMETAVDVTELVDRNWLTPSSAQSLPRFQQAVQAFYQLDWQLAESLFQECQDDHSAAKFFLRNIRQHQGNPPPDWPARLDLPTKASGFGE
ncbi:MAG: adenylate/guanylate cyclase domain-containing protein [Planctomycetales bacterium]|nr:adenylate/guanylate cyclase domain-containing protein [Planctomycetales bacterium]